MICGEEMKINMLSKNVAMKERKKSVAEAATGSWRGTDNISHDFIWSGAQHSFVYNTYGWLMLMCDRN